MEMVSETFVAASELLERAAEAGVFLSYRQERLHFKLSAEVFPETLKSEIVANKAALIAFLSQRELDHESTRTPSARESAGARDARVFGLTRTTAAVVPRSTRRR
jgi:hypothetical protein